MQLLLRLHQVKRDIMSRFLRDANSFVASSSEAIERSAPHIYLSALPFADRDTLVYQTFPPLCTGLVSVETFGINYHGQQLSMMLTGHENRVVSVVYSPDGCLLASGSTDGTIRIWDTRTGEENLCLSQSSEDAVNSIAFAPNSKSIASGTDSGVYIWTGLAGRPTALLLSGHSDDVMTVEYSQDGYILASRSKDRTIRLWRAENGENTVILRGHAGHVDAIAFSPNGQTLAFCSSEYKIQLWSIRTGDPVGLLHLQSGGKILSIGFSPDGTMLAAGCDNGTIVLLECQTRNAVTELRGHTGCISSIQFHQMQDRWCLLHMTSVSDFGPSRKLHGRLSLLYSSVILTTFAALRSHRMGYTLPRPPMTEQFVSGIPE